MTELDVHHLGTVCARLAERAGTGLTITPTPAGVRVAAPSPAAVRQVRAGLVRTGYDARRLRRFGAGNELAVSGWNPRALARRIAALRTEIDRLTGSRRETAAAAVARVDARPEDPRAGTQRRLRHQVEAYAGVIAPSDPRTGPADPDALRLLNTVRHLERQVIERIDHHAATAELAVRLYARYRRHTGDELARDAAVHDAYLAGRHRKSTGPERRLGAAIPALKRSRHALPNRPDGVSVATRDFPGRIADAATARPARTEPRPPQADGPGATHRRAR